jgi:hypothetical protein
LILAVLVAAWSVRAGATNFYELQIYTVETTPRGSLAGFFKGTAGWIF